MKKIILGILAVALVMGCGGGMTPDNGDMAKTTQNIYYIKDIRTNLCFATIESPVYLGMVVSITNVPCAALKHVPVTTGPVGN